GRMVSVERETFPAVIQGEKPLYAYTTADYWLDLGKPEAYLASHRDIFEGAMPLLVDGAVAGPGAATVPPGALVAPVFVGRGVRIHPE
ncbi:MAG: NDP-sugar synthase, partial [Candidatus Velthaea sp.]